MQCESLSIIIMFIQLLFRCVGISFDTRRTRIGITFMCLAITISFVYTASANMWMRDFVRRPWYLKLLRGSIYSLEVVSCVFIYYWALKHQKVIEASIDRNFMDQLIFCLSFSKNFIDTAAFLSSVLRNDDLVSSRMLKLTMCVCSSCLLVITTFVNASKVLLCGLLRRVLAKVSEAMKSTMSTEDICTAVCRYLAEVNALVSLPLMVLHAHYFLWSFAQFGCDLPTTVCSYYGLLFFIPDSLEKTLLLIRVLYLGAMVADKSRELRRRVQKHFSEVVSETSTTKRWVPGCVVALEGVNLGVVFDGVHAIDWKSITGFFGFCWSAGFVVFQISLADARDNYHDFCQSSN